jgi:hypothetical protein
MTWIIGTLSYLGVLLLGWSAYLHKSQPKKVRQQFAMLLVGVVLLGCVAIVALLGALPAKAQVALAPGQAMQVCNTVYTTTGGGVTCSHVPEAKTVRMSYHGDSWHRTFWGEGAQPAFYLTCAGMRPSSSLARPSGRNTRWIAE